MRLLLAIFLTFFLAVPAHAASATDEKPSADSTPAKTASSSEGENGKADAAQEEGANSDEKAEQSAQAEEGVYSCDYYKVKLPEGWRAILPPEERQGNVNAIFASKNDQVIITPIVGPRGGADAQTIASMFAEQFKAPEPPVERNGQYFFSFEQTDAATGNVKKVDACVATDGDEFMVTTWTGDPGQAMAFIQNDITSEKYPGLLPRIEGDTGESKDVKMESQDLGPAK